MTAVFFRAWQQVGTAFAHNWPFLVVAVVVSAVLRVYSDQSRIRRWLERRRTGSVLVATGIAVGTPLCSCGTMAIILGMMASSIPWAPIVAFMVASPLTSPSELVYSAGLFGWPFALTYFGASVALGLSAGALARFLDTRGWLRNQARFAPQAASRLEEQPAGDGPGRPAFKRLFREMWTTGLLLLFFFTSFAFIGYFLNGLIPRSAVTALFGPGRKWGVTLAAGLGLPLYINSEASLPLVKAFLANGASPGAAMAFLITGAGTSIGAIAGALAIAKWRVVGLIIAVLLLGAIVFGYGYDILLAIGLPAASPSLAP